MLCFCFLYRIIAELEVEVETATTEVVAAQMLDVHVVSVADTCKVVLSCVGSSG